MLQLCKSPLSFARSSTGNISSFKITHRTWSGHPSKNIRYVHVTCGVVTKHQDDAFAGVKLATGDFKKLRTSGTMIVDKTLFIKDYITNSTGASLFIYPRRWGKSTNLTMWKYFLQPVVDDKGNIIPLEKNLHYKLFVGGEIELNNEKMTLEPLDIAGYPHIIEKYCNKYPVIHINLYNKPTSYEDAMSFLKEVISNLYEEHQYITNYLSVTNYNKYNNYLNGNIDKTGIIFGIKFLSKLLSQHFKKECFILVDEYDAPINSILMDQTIDRNTIENILNLYQEFYAHSFKENNYCTDVILTGILRVAKGNVLSGFNNLVEYNMTVPRFAQYYGFTKDEVYTIFKDAPDILINKVDKYYNGYNIGNYQLYNPWSIVNTLNALRNTTPAAIHEFELKNYWTNTASDKYIKDFFINTSIRNIMVQLIAEKSISFDLRTNISPDDFEMIKYVMNNDPDSQLDATHLSVFFSFLFHTGYLSNTNKKDTYKLPNLEVKNYLTQLLFDFYSYKYGVSEVVSQDITNKLELFLNSSSNEKVKTFNNLRDSIANIINLLPPFGKVTKPSASISGTSSISKYSDNKKFSILHANEAVMQSLFNAALLPLVPKFTEFGIEVPVKSIGNIGRMDTLFIYKDMCIIIEFIFGQSADKAIQQIKDKQYDSNYLYLYSGLYIGINVNDDKTVDIKYEEVARDSFNKS